MSNAKLKKNQSANRSRSESSTGVCCVECGTEMKEKDEALFVEETVGRYFCSEPCIVSFFTPQIEELEREYGRHVLKQDLNSKEKEETAHLRWLTLESPQEVWKERIKTGDDRYALVSEHQVNGQKVYGVAITLMLRGEPSFLFLAFMTKDSHLVDVFRRGEQQAILKRSSSEDSSRASVSNHEDPDRLADAWNESDSVRVRLRSFRKDDDISEESFESYQGQLEEVLQKPTELWSYAMGKNRKAYHFLKQYSGQEDYWYIVIAKDAEDISQIEIVDAFPTKDPELLEYARHGKREVLQGDDPEASLPMAVGSSGKRHLH